LCVFQYKIIYYCLKPFEHGKNSKKDISKCIESQENQ